MIALDNDFAGTFPFRPNVSTAPGFGMHYVDEGSGAPILLLHGEPSWSYLYREVIPRLAMRGRVIAPDMKGFGKSETPDDNAYSPADQARALEALLLDLDLSEVTLVVHDWGGPIGSMVAAWHPDRFARVVVINAALSLGHPCEGPLLAQAIAAAPYFRYMASLYRRGLMDTVLGELGTLVPTIMRDLQGVVSTHANDPTWVRAYSAPFTTPAECVGAIALPKFIVAGERVTVPDSVAAVRILSKPTMMIYGMRDRVLIPEFFINIFKSQYPESIIYRLENAGHFAPDDEPEVIAHLIDLFIQSDQRIL